MLKGDQMNIKSWSQGQLSTLLLSPCLDPVPGEESYTRDRFPKVAEPAVPWGKIGYITCCREEVLLHFMDLNRLARELVKTRKPICCPETL